MKAKLFSVLIAFIAFGSYCKGQELKPEKGANGKWGFIDATGKEVIPLKYDYAEPFSEYLFSKMAMIYT
jgi:hypothetical protein